MADTVRGIVQRWLANGDDDDDVARVSAALVAEVAAAHPAPVLAEASRVGGLAPPDATAPAPEPPRTVDAPRPQRDEQRAWEVLIETATSAPETVWTAIDSEQLRSWLDGDTTTAARARELYAHCVPLPVPDPAITTLFDQLLADRAGAQQALSTLASRAPAPIVRAAVAQLDGSSAPPAQAIELLEQLSADWADDLRPLRQTVWEWNGTIQPSDGRWDDLVTVLGRIAIAADDDQTISRMLHLDDPEYCDRFLATPVSAALIQAAPNKAIPALLEWLSADDASRRRAIVRVFDAYPDGERYEGWGPPIRTAVFERVDDPNWRVRMATTRTLGTWLETFLRGDTATAEDQIERVRTALVEQLDDDHWRARIAAIRSLDRWSDQASRQALENLLATETTPNVRFEALRVLRTTDQ